MWHFGIFRTKPNKGPSRRNALLRTIYASCALLMLLSVPVRAAHQPPDIYEPAAAATMAGPAVTIKGTSAGDVEVVRVLEGATILGEAGPSNGFWAMTVSMPDGAHTIRARARDASNQWSAFSSPLTFSVDSVAPPAPAIVSPPDGSLIATNPVTVEGDAEPGTTITVDVSTGGTETAVASGSGAWSFTRSFTDAAHSLVARAIDAAGNVSLDSPPVTFSVDTMPPPAPLIDTPGDGALVRPHSVVISGRAEPGSTVAVSEGAVIGTVIVSTGGTWSMTRSFSEGWHSISARATDLAGHVGPASAPMRFRVDSTAPAAPTILSPLEGSIVRGRYIVGGIAPPRRLVQLMSMTTVVAETVAASDGSWSLERISFGGHEQVQARARDDAGNVSALTPVRTFFVDAHAPIVTITTRDGTIFLPSQTPRIEGTATDNVGVQGVEVRISDILETDVRVRIATCAGCPSGTAVDWYIQPGLPPGRYEVRAYAIDRAGNRSNPAEITYLEL